MPAPPLTTGEIELLIPDLSTTPSHVFAYSWGLSQSATTHIGGGGGAGKVNFQDISLTKRLDHLSVPVALKVTTGAHLSSATLSFFDVTGGSRVLVGTYTLEDVIVSSVSTGGSVGGQAITEFTENVTLNFARIRSQWTLEGASFNSCYDIAANMAC